MDKHRAEIEEFVDEQSRERNSGLFRIYNYYRIVIGVSLLIVFEEDIGFQLLGSADPDLFVSIVAAYILTNVAIAAGTLALPSRIFDNQVVMFVVVSLDIVALATMMHASGGVSSGLGNLIIVTIAAGSILVSRGTAAYILPAIGSLVILYDEFYLSLLGAFAPDYTQAGVLGGLYFGTSMAVQILSQRLRNSEIVALQRSMEVAQLEKLNHLIVQRMRTGIIVMTDDNTTALMNESARQLLKSPNTVDDNAVPPELIESLTAWRAAPGTRPQPFRTHTSGPELQPNFSVLTEEEGADTLIFLEDSSQLAQQAQQIKLAALGRLSASIAHEIRNPLGAVSHSAQLLRESENLDDADRRLTDIIQNHSERMNGVIENVLELSRRKLSQPELIELKPWLEKFVRDLRESGHLDAEIDVEVEPADLTARMDPSQLSQVVTNIAQNGLRYSNKRLGKETLQLQARVEQHSERPYLDIVDEGPGVDPEQVDHLFEPFFTTENTGTGLGLYISRELCEANQALLSYLPQEQGSCFRITFVHPRRIVA